MSYLADRRASPPLSIPPPGSLSAEFVSGTFRERPDITTSATFRDCTALKWESRGELYLSSSPSDLDLESRRFVHYRSAMGNGRPVHSETSGFHCFAFYDAASCLVSANATSCDCQMAMFCLTGMRDDARRWPRPIRRLRPFTRERVCHSAAALFQRMSACLWVRHGGHKHHLLEIDGQFMSATTMCSGS
jgi:hypothetical protein